MANDYEPTRIWASPFGCRALALLGIFVLAVLFITNCGPHGCGF